MADSTAAAAAAVGTISAPQITEDELRAFHETHFSTTQVETYAEEFLGPVDGNEGDFYKEEFADDLGYYEDGVRRTLTDEQIAMFRHSEIQALLRKRRLAEEAKEFGMEPDAAEDGELVDEKTVQQQKNTGKDKKKKGKEKSWYKRNIKPDLRKRTWDKVDQGLESLEYGDEAAAQPVAKTGVQRKLISYDD